MSNNVEIQTQKLVTQEVAQLYEFSFPTGGYVYLASATEWEPGWGKLGPISWETGPQTHEYIEIQMSGVRSDLTGALTEPNLIIAADKLWSFSSWSSATSGFTSLTDYQGIRVRRQRMFYDIGVHLFFPQTYYIKSVDDFNAYSISFTLTPTLGGDKIDQPSARKLETRPE